MDSEVHTYQWTLMHRFHKAADIINEVRAVWGGGLEGIGWQGWPPAWKLVAKGSQLVLTPSPNPSAPPPQVLDGFFEVDADQALADVYVWLRYSASRQLTWQRNYNTQPRILSAAQVGGGVRSRGDDHLNERLLV
jgi:hypothetical protein